MAQRTARPLPEVWKPGHQAQGEDRDGARGPGRSARPAAAVLLQDLRQELYAGTRQSPARRPVRRRRGRRGRPPLRPGPSFLPRAVGAAGAAPSPPRGPDHPEPLGGRRRRTVQDSTRGLLRARAAVGRVPGSRRQVHHGRAQGGLPAGGGGPSHSGRGARLGAPGGERRGVRAPGARGGDRSRISSAGHRHRPRTRVRPGLPRALRPGPVPGLPDPLRSPP